MTCPIEWDNYDSSPTLKFQKIPMVGRVYCKNRTRFPDNLRVGDIVKGLDVPSGSAEAVYCSHTLEHLSLQELRKCLANVYDMTASGGIFRMVLPDLEYYIKRFEADTTPEACSRFMRDTYLGEESPWSGMVGFLTYTFGTSKHRWMWDYKGLACELAGAGFTDIRRAQMSDCEVPALKPLFAQVESHGRWLNCLGIQCRKPQPG